MTGDDLIHVPEVAHPRPARLTFTGERHEHVTLVCVTAGGQASRQLPLYLGVRQHSPTGFDWGSSGNGAAKLALAMCIEIVGRQRAERVYQDIKDALLAPIEDDCWMLSGARVLTAIVTAERRIGIVED
jgi:hypothetical protein